jgi:hypothetical protein
MATLKYKCPCYDCNGKKKPVTKRTIQDHWKKNTEHLAKLRTTGGLPRVVKYTKKCSYKLSKLLNSIKENSQTSRQPYPDSEQFVNLLMSNNDFTDQY